MTTTEYTPQVVDHFTNPRNPGRLPDATGSGQAGDGKNGELLIQISIQASEGVVKEARFRAFGCSASIACASVTTELLGGRTLEGALALAPEEVEAALGGLPQSRQYCARYAADAARAAAQDNLNRARPSGVIAPRMPGRSGG